MCVTCGCALDVTATGNAGIDHGNPANITAGDVVDAAAAAGITVDQAVANLLPSLATAGLVPCDPEDPPLSPEVDAVVQAALDDEVVVKALQVPANPKRFVLGVAYAPDTVDGHGEFMSADELERIAWEYCRKHRQIGFYHANGTLAHADVVESYIHRGPDWHTTDIDGHEQVIKSGSWVLGAIFDDIGFDQVTSKKADGWSMDGLMGRRKVPRPG